MTTQDAGITFSNEEKAAIGQRIQRYFEDELGQEIGQFDAEFLLDFFAHEIGAFFYNRGLYDAQALLASRMETVAEAIYELEKETHGVR
ncbi:MAG: DUF2164 domain-containing protein [Gammaproteobacteria bacterium]|jgi:uncharacterized protein (DUF2164 family)|nr:DUF2164 domain-containing protein [Gammaproteobacteria bacterium]